MWPFQALALSQAHHNLAEKQVTPWVFINVFITLPSQES